MRAIKVLSVFALVFATKIVFAMEIDKGKVTLEKIEDYNQCQTLDYGGSFCHDALVRWVEKNPSDAFKAGKMTRLKMNHYNAVPFFSKAMEGTTGDCKDADVKMAVLSALALPSTGNETLITQAKTIALDKCGKELAQAVAEEAKASDYILKNSCKELVAKKLLTGVAAKRCQKM